MSSMTSSPSTFLSSPRNQRLMMWFSGVVLLAGVAVFLGVYLRGTDQAVHPSSNAAVVSQGPVAKNPVGDLSAQTVPASATALKVARQFLLTAVARKHLDVAWGLVGPWLKGEPRAQWIKGNNPVQPLPNAANLKTAPLKVLTSTKNALFLEVGPFVPKRGTFGGQRSLAFKMEVDRIGGKWLVNYFMADYTIPKLATDKAGSSGN